VRGSAGAGPRNEAIFSGELGRSSKRASVTLGVAMLVAIFSVVSASVGLSLNFGRADVYTVKAHFPTVNGVIENSDVFFGGVRVGFVSGLEVDKDSHGATLTLNIEKAYAPLHEGATAQVRPKSLLGEKYIAATVGDPSKPAIEDGSTLPDSATNVNVELDELINILDQPTRDELQKLLHNLGLGLAGQGLNTNETFQTGRRNLDDLAAVTDVLQQRDTSLKRIIVALDKLTATLSTDPNRQTYVNLLKHSDQVLKILKEEDASVEQGIERMNTFFGQLDSGLNGREGDLRAIFGDIPETVTDLDALSQSLAHQGHVGKPVIQEAGAAAVEGPIIFGSQPAHGTSAFTNDVFTRVMPAQGCFDVNGRKVNDQGLYEDTPPPPIRPGPANATPLCTLPGIQGLACSTTDALTCLNAIGAGLCTIVHPPTCPFMAANQNSALQPGTPTIPTPSAPAGGGTPSPSVPAPSPSQASGLLDYLLKR
jgi:virulence factor Mce-like protein